MMTVIRRHNCKETPASHEDPKNPGTVKRVLFSKNDLVKGRIQMVNWARLLKGRSFRAHYHEDMEEIFIIVVGKATMYVGDDSTVLAKGDAVVVPIGTTHWMENSGREEVEYLTVGISLGQGGKTRVV